MGFLKQSPHTSRTSWIHFTLVTACQALNFQLKVGTNISECNILPLDCHTLLHSNLSGNTYLCNLITEMSSGAERYMVLS